MFARYRVPEENDAALAPEIRLDEIFQPEESEDNIDDQLYTQDTASVIAALTAKTARGKLAYIEAIIIYSTNTA